jgi:peptidoglycan DL-endopeptidase CwlO
LAWQHGGFAWERMSAAGQWQWLHRHGHDVPTTQLRAGDLLFYANNPRDPASIHHVAMAIGNRRMVEAPEPGIPVRVVAVRWDGLYAAARPAA